MSNDLFLLWIKEKRNKGAYVEEITYEKELKNARNHIFLQYKEKVLKTAGGVLTSMEMEMTIFHSNDSESWNNIFFSAALPP